MRGGLLLSAPVFSPAVIFSHPREYNDLQERRGGGESAGSNKRNEKDRSRGKEAHRQIGGAAGGDWGDVRMFSVGGLRGLQTSAPKARLDPGPAGPLFAEIDPLDQFPGAQSPWTRPGEEAWLYLQPISASLDIHRKEAVWGNEKAKGRQIGASSICHPLPFSGLLRNLRPSSRADPRLKCMLTNFDTTTAPEMTAACRRQ